MYVLLIILLVVLPFGTAILCGALMQWAGDTISGWSSDPKTKNRLFEPISSIQRRSSASR